MRSPSSSGHRPRSRHRTRAAWSHPRREHAPGSLADLLSRINQDLVDADAALQNKDLARYQQLVDEVKTLAASAQQLLNTSNAVSGTTPSTTVAEVGHGRFGVVRFGPGRPGRRTASRLISGAPAPFWSALHRGWVRRDDRNEVCPGGRGIVTIYVVEIPAGIPPPAGVQFGAGDQRRPKPCDCQV